MRRLSRPLINRSVLVLAAFLAACQPKAIPMTPEETQRMETLTANMTTRCVGRYLIDMPSSFVLNSESNTEIEGIKIAMRPMDKRLFEMTLAGREAELKRMHMAGKPNRLFLKRVETAPVIALGKVFNRAEESGAAEFGRTLELLAWRDGYEVRMSINSTDGTDIPFDTSVVGTPFEASGRRIWSEYKDRNDTPEKLAHLLKVYERVSGRKDTEIPTEQGVCFANGFVKGPPTDEEVLFIRHDLENAPDVGSTFHSLSNITEDTELLDRSAAIEADLKERSGRTLRKGKSSAQIPGAQEWLMTKKSRDSGLMQAMTLEANSKIGSAATPVVIFGLNAGGGYRTQPKSNEEAATRPPLTKNTFSEAEAMSIWDKVSATLRPRPGAF